MSRIVRKPDFCLGENKGADQLRSNCEADQRLCFRYTDSTISLLLLFYVLFLSHLLIAGCDIGVQISVRPYVRSSVRSFVRPSTFTSKFSFLDIRDS